MKVTKIAWIILGIGIFIIAFISLYMLYSRENNSAEQLEDNLVFAQNTLAQINTQKSNSENQLTQLESNLSQVESELTQARSLLAQSRTNYPASVESIEYDERLFEIADSWGLTITSLTASEPVDETVTKEGTDAGDISFSITSFDAHVVGEVSDVLGFINTIVASEDFTCATAELVNITVPEPFTEEEKEKMTETFTGILFELLTNEELTEEERQELLDALVDAFMEAQEVIEELERPSATISMIIYGYEGE